MPNWQRQLNVTVLTPIAAGLWTDDRDPRLIGGRHAQSGRIAFPMPEGDSAAHYEAVPLSRTGTLWSWTVQGFEPKSPYSGPQPFEPYGVGYVELPGEVIVETRLTRTTNLRIGMAMELVVEDFGQGRSTFAFKPTEDL
jgi:uncharacterized protein